MIDVDIEQGLVFAVEQELKADLLPPIASPTPPSHSSGSNSCHSSATPLQKPSHAGDPFAAAVTSEVLQQVTERLQASSGPTSTSSSTTSHPAPPPSSPPPQKKARRSRWNKSDKGRAAKREKNKAARQDERQAEVVARKEQQREAGADSIPAYQVRPSLLRKLASVEVDELKTSAEALPACLGAWTGQYVKEGGRVLTLQQALNMGLRLKSWDGVKTVVLVDRQHVILGVLYGRPSDSSQREPWTDTLAGVERAIKQLNSELHWGKNEVLPRFPKRKGGKGKNRRGKYKAVSHGPSYGGGQTKPGNLTHTESNLAALERFNKDPAVQRMKSVANAGFAYYAPKLYDYYVKTLAELYKHDPSLVPPFKGAIWANVTIGVSDQCVSSLHRDHNNLAFGWCAIQPLGDFDPKAGGHLILQQLGIVAEFPPGTTAFLTSAVVTHGNTTIGPEETRKSMISYCAGGLFRWVQYGFRTWEQFLEAEEDLAKEEWAKRKVERPKFALSLFSTVDSLVEDHSQVGR
ncbi:hypothetical protein PsYK624_045960 [Phanerochaete sordida]|uniref:Uncharacterized protein n=1 Tax=Phanerochaete sordida TaxID=48140 RepID=A0A9P3LBW1_9APHY|nr:hypothetical protein PsYK624_045960 [Phanerochaete sordida]